MFLIIFIYFTDFKINKCGETQTVFHADLMV